MKTFKLDSKNNLIVNGSFIMLEGSEAVAQDIKNLLLMFQTEYPFDTRVGIPYYDLAIGNNKEVIKGSIINRVLEDTRVKSVSRIDVSFKNGTMNISLDLRLKNGETINV